MSNKKKVLIPGWSLGDNAWGVTKPYLEYLSQFGQVEILTPRQETVDGDLLVIPGGLDMSPFSYGQVPGFMTSNHDVYKQYFYDQNLEGYVNKGTPIFGICLGAQELAVYFGAELVQDWSFEYSTPRSKAIEKVKVSKQIEEWGYQEDTKKYEVNSLHHQGIFALPDCLEPLMTSIDFGNIECFSHKTLPIIGYQGHPEESKCPIASFLIRKLLNS